MTDNEKSSATAMSDNEIVKKIKRATEAWNRRADNAE